MADNVEHIVHIRGEGGSVFALSLPLHETIVEKLTKGYVRRVNADGSQFDGDPHEVPGLPAERPDDKALKAVWVGYAVANGADPDDAEAATKADLIEMYGA